MNITTIILTYNEELHIRRCIENILPISRKILIIDCHSSDRTVKICSEYEQVTVVQHTWPGNQAEQFNWALAHCPIDTEWILRLDADEYATPAMIAELQAKLPDMPDHITGVVFPLSRVFLGKQIKHGMDQIKILRLFRTGKASYEHRIMDEHIVLHEGSSVDFQGAFVDDNLHDIAWWTAKHINYAAREVSIMMGSNNEEEDGALASATQSKRHLKNKYAGLPLFWRAFAYFFYRYFLRLGFLDGKEGFLWHFLQGWWYRTLIDAQIYEKFNSGHHTQTQSHQK